MRGETCRRALGICCLLVITVACSVGASSVSVLLLEAIETHRLLGGVSFDAVFLIGSGLIDGRSVCNAPHYRGIVNIVFHVERVLNTSDVTSIDECVHVDETKRPVLVTAGYRCVPAFVSAFMDEAEKLLSE